MNNNASGGYVYFAQRPCQPDLIKVGCTRYLERRIKQIGRDVVLLRAFPFSGRHAMPYEKCTHRFLAAQRVSGEWFRVTMQEALWAFMSAVRHVNWRASIRYDSLPDPMPLNFGKESPFCGFWRYSGDPDPRETFSFQ